MTGLRWLSYKQKNTGVTHTANISLKYIYQGFVFPGMHLSCLVDVSSLSCRIFITFESCFMTNGFLSLSFWTRLIADHSNAEPRHEQQKRPHESSHYGLWKTTAPRGVAAKSAMISRMLHKGLSKSCAAEWAMLFDLVSERLCRLEKAWGSTDVLDRRGSNSFTIPWLWILSLVAGFWFEWANSLSLYSSTGWLLGTGERMGQINVTITTKPTTSHTCKQTVDWAICSSQNQNSLF